MFQTVRHWWTGGRGKVTARLFLFELLVVVLGVLIAQGLANWVDDRAARADMEAARNRLRLQLADSAAAADAWQRAAPCLDARMVEVMERLSSGDLDPAMTRRPAFATFRPLSMDDRSAILLRKHYGDAEADVIEAGQVAVQAAADNQRQMIHSWGRLSLADPAAGPPSRLDRQQARLAAADIRAELRGLMFIAGAFGPRVQAIGIVPRFAEPVRAIHDCAEMWATGRTTVPR